MGAHKMWWVVASFGLSLWTVPWDAARCMVYRTRRSRRSASYFVYDNVLFFDGVKYDYTLNDPRIDQAAAVGVAIAVHSSLLR